MSVQTLANLIATSVHGRTTTKMVHSAVYYGDHVYMDNRNYKCDVAVDIDLQSGETCYVVLDDTGNMAVIVGK